MEIDLLSVIVPVYKQQKTIKQDLTRILATLKQTPYKFEIIVVIDGTTLDNSYKEAKQIKDNALKVYGYPTNKGKGQAVRYGMEKAKGDILTFIDSGMDIDPKGIIMLIQHMDWYNADIVVGSKLHSASIVQNYTLQRKIMTYVYYRLVKLLFGLRIRDTQTGLKVFKRKPLEKTLPLLVVKRFAFDIEILAVANYIGYTKIYDAPVQVAWKHQDVSMHRVFKLFTKGTILNFLTDTFAVWYRMKILKYYDDGKQREKIFDDELKIYVNTGNMKNPKKQKIIELVNNIASFGRKKD